MNIRKYSIPNSQNSTNSNPDLVSVLLERFSKWNYITSSSADGSHPIVPLSRSKFEDDDQFLVPETSKSEYSLHETTLDTDETDEGGAELLCYLRCSDEEDIQMKLSNIQNEFENRGNEVSEEDFVNIFMKYAFEEDPHALNHTEPTFFNDPSIYDSWEESGFHVSPDLKEMMLNFSQTTNNEKNTLNSNNATNHWNSSINHIKAPLNSSNASHKEENRLKHIQHLRNLFQLVDLDRGGSVSWTEVTDFIVERTRSKDTRQSFSAMKLKRLPITDKVVHSTPVSVTVTIKQLGIIACCDHGSSRINFYTLSMQFLPLLTHPPLSSPIAAMAFINSKNALVISCKDLSISFLTLPHNIFTSLRRCEFDTFKYSANHSHQVTTSNLIGSALGKGPVANRHLSSNHDNGLDGSSFSVSPSGYSFFIFRTVFVPATQVVLLVSSDGQKLYGGDSMGGIFCFDVSKIFSSLKDSPELLLSQSALMANNSSNGSNNGLAVGSGSHNGFPTPATGSSSMGSNLKSQFLNNQTVNSSNNNSNTLESGINAIVTASTSSTSPLMDASTPQIIEAALDVLSSSWTCIVKWSRERMHGWVSRTEEQHTVILQQKLIAESTKRLKAKEAEYYSKVRAGIIKHDRNKLLEALTPVPVSFSKLFRDKEFPVPDVVTCLCEMPKLDRLASGGLDGNIRILSSTSGQCLELITRKSPLCGGVLAPELENYDDELLYCNTLHLTPVMDKVGNAYRFTTKRLRLGMLNEWKKRCKLYESYLKQYFSGKQIRNSKSDADYSYVDDHTDFNDSDEDKDDDFVNFYNTPNQQRHSMWSDAKHRRLEELILILPNLFKNLGSPQLSLNNDQALILLSLTQKLLFRHNSVINSKSPEKNSNYTKSSTLSTSNFPNLKESEIDVQFLSLFETFTYGDPVIDPEKEDNKQHEARRRLVWQANRTKALRGGGITANDGAGGLTGASSSSVSGHKRGILTLLYCEDQKLLLSGGFDCTILAWNPLVGSRTFVGQGHQAPIISMKSVDTKTFQFVSLDTAGVIRVWLSSTCTCIQEISLEDIASSVTGITHLTNTEFLVTGRKLIVLSSNCQGTISKTSLEAVVAVKLLPGLRCLAVASGSTVAIWDLQMCLVRHTMSIGAEISSIDTDPLTRKLIVADSNGATHVFSSSTFSLVGMARNHFSDISKVVVCVGDATAITVGADRSIVIQEASIELGINNPNTISSDLFDADHDGSFMNFGNEIGDSRKKSMLRSTISNSSHSKPNKRSNTPSKRLILNSRSSNNSSDSTLSATPFSSGSSVRSLQPFRVIEESHTSDITCVAYSRRLKLFATGSERYTVCVWDFERVRLELCLVGHRSAITCVEFLEPLPLLCTADSSGSVRVWLMPPHPVAVSLTKTKIGAFKQSISSRGGSSTFNNAVMVSQILCVARFTNIRGLDSSSSVVSMKFLFADAYAARCLNTNIHSNSNHKKDENEDSSPFKQNELSEKTDTTPAFKSIFDTIAVSESQLDNNNDNNNKSSSIRQVNQNMEQSLSNTPHDNYPNSQTIPNDGFCISPSILHYAINPPPTFATGLQPIRSFSGMNSIPVHTSGIYNYSNLNIANNNINNSSNYTTFSSNNNVGSNAKIAPPLTPGIIPSNGTHLSIVAPHTIGSPALAASSHANILSSSRSAANHNAVNSSNIFMNDKSQSNTGMKNKLHSQKNSIMSPRFELMPPAPAQRSLNIRRASANGTLRVLILPPVHSFKSSVSSSIPHPQLPIRPQTTNHFKTDIGDSNDVFAVNNGSLTERNHDTKLKISLNLDARGKASLPVAIKSQFSTSNMDQTKVSDETSATNEFLTPLPPNSAVSPLTTSVKNNRTLKFSGNQHVKSESGLNHIETLENKPLNPSPTANNSRNSTFSKCDPPLPPDLLMCLITGDAEGNLRIWDFRGFLMIKDVEVIQVPEGKWEPYRLERSNQAEASMACEQAAQMCPEIEASITVPMIRKITGWPAHKGASILDIAIAADLNSIITAGADGCVMLWSFDGTLRGNLSPKDSEEWRRNVKNLYEEKEEYVLKPIVKEVGIAIPAVFSSGM